MQKKIITSAILISFAGFGSTANAGLANGSLGLDIQGNLNPACLYGGTYPACQFGEFDTADAGSYFTMDGNAYSAAIDGDAIMMLDGSAQGFNGTAVPPDYIGDGTHVTAVWDFFGALGTNVHNGLSVSNNDTEVDMSTWGATWSTVPFMNMGGDTANIASDTGIGALVCTGGIDANACEAGETFTLDYAAHIPADDPSMFGGVLYELHLQGNVVNAVPVPAAAWLFGSGLLGLAGVARRRINA